MDDLILAIDQGTTATTVGIVDRGLGLRAKATREHPQIFPRPGWVEHDPERIWKSVVEAIGEALAKASARPSAIAAIGVTNQRETVVAWDARGGRALGNAIVWQCRRTTEYCRRRLKPIERDLIRRTGLRADPYFSATKLNWLMKNRPGAAALARAGRLRVGTIDTFLLARLSGGAVHRTDPSNASRTQLMDIAKCAWDPVLLRRFGVPPGALAEIVDSCGPLGRVRGVPGLLDGTPVTGVVGDQQAALFGQGCFRPGTAKCTFGTGSFVLMNTGADPVRSKSGLLTTVAWRLPGGRGPTYALEGGAFVCGAAVQWLRDGLGFFPESADVEALARGTGSTDGVYLVPAFVGLGAPWWDPDARAALVGMTRGTTAAHVARATLEAMALQNVDILRAMRGDSGSRARSLRVDGGAAANALLLQMQADFLGTAVERAAQVESTVVGAAYIAGLGAGIWRDLAELERALKDSARETTTFRPTIGAGARREKLRAWHRAVQRVRSAEK